MSNPSLFKVHTRKDSKIHASAAQAKKCEDEILKIMMEKGVKKRIAYAMYYEPSLFKGIGGKDKVK